MTEKQGKYIAQKMDEWAALRRSYLEAESQIKSLREVRESTGSRGFVGFTGSWGPGVAARMEYNREGVSISGLATLAELDFSTLRAFALEALERRVSETKAAMEAFKLEMPKEEADWKPGDRLRNKLSPPHVAVYCGNGFLPEEFYGADDDGHFTGIRANFDKLSDAEQWKPGDRVRLKSNPSRMLIYKGYGPGEGDFSAEDFNGGLHSSGWRYSDFEKVPEGAE